MEWISVKDRLPEEGQKVLTYLGEFDGCRTNYLILCPYPIWACLLETEEVTHWMLLPEPPKEES